MAFWMGSLIILFVTSDSFKLLVKLSVLSIQSTAKDTVT